VLGVLTFEKVRLKQTAEKIRNADASLGLTKIQS
jgi:hypothetical protein